MCLQCTPTPLAIQTVPHAPSFTYTVPHASLPDNSLCTLSRTDLYPCPCFFHILLPVSPFLLQRLVSLSPLSHTDWLPCLLTYCSKCMPDISSCSFFSLHKAALGVSPFSSCPVMWPTLNHSTLTFATFLSYLFEVHYLCHVSIMSQKVLYLF